MGREDEAPDDGAAGSVPEVSPRDRSRQGSVGDSGLSTTFVAPDARPEPKSRRLVAIGIMSAISVFALIIVGIVVFDQTSAALSPGSGTARINWVPVRASSEAFSSPPQSFSGSIGGYSLSGVATMTVPSADYATEGPPNAPRFVQVFHYRGSFANKPFTIGVSYETPLSTSTASTVSLFITGTYAGQAVRAVITAPNNSSGISAPVPLVGSIGKWKVTGAIKCCTGTSLKQTATASYTVSA